MYSISEIAELTNLTPRALRHYEEKGLIDSIRGNEFGHRFYSSTQLAKIEEIKKFKKMEFSLDEIKSFLECDENLLKSNLTGKLNKKIQELDAEISRLQKSREDANHLLLTTQQFFKGMTLEKGQRRIIMDAIKSEILEQLKAKRKVNHRDLEYLNRENYLLDTPEKQEFLNAVKDCLRFAREQGIKLGPTRGASPALLSLYAIGWSSFDPIESNLVPERFSATDFNLQIDVEFKNGKKFINYCKGISNNLKIGSIEAFRLPILDIIDNVHAKIGKKIDYDSISNDDPMILDLFRKGDIEKIFSFDIPKETLLARHFDSDYYKDGSATKMLSEYLKSQKIFDYRDILNIEAIFRPDNLKSKPFMREYIDRYPKAKINNHYYKELTPSLNEYLRPNFGVIIYQEDIIHIIREYTSWSFEKCNYFRRQLAFRKISEYEKMELVEYTGDDVYQLLDKESPVVYCKAHSVGAWPKLIKVTAILKSKHKKTYFEEIAKWEEANGYSWGDFGFISNGISLLQ